MENVTYWNTDYGNLNWEWRSMKLLGQVDCCMGRNAFFFTVSCFSRGRHGGLGTNLARVGNPKPNVHVPVPSFLSVEWKILLNYLLCCVKFFPCISISHLKPCVKFDPKVRESRCKQQIKLLDYRLWKCKEKGKTWIVMGCCVKKYTCWISLTT